MKQKLLTFWRDKDLFYMFVYKLSVSILGLSISYYFIFRKKDDSNITNI